MSDVRLRELERKWKETGSVEDEAAYLLERVRVGDLSRERLELAAYCGHEGARRALEGGPLESFSSADQTRIRQWAPPIDHLPIEGRVRVSLVAAQCAVVTAWNQVSPEDSRPSRAIDAAMGWLSCPCTAHAEDVEIKRVAAASAFRECVEHLDREVVPAADVSRKRAYAGNAADSSAAAVRFLMGGSSDDASRMVTYAMRAALHAAGDQPAFWAACAHRAREAFLGASGA